MLLRPLPLEDALPTYGLRHTGRKTVFLRQRQASDRAAEFFDAADGVLFHDKTCNAQSRLTNRRHRRCRIVGTDLPLETQPRHALSSKLPFKDLQRPQNRELRRLPTKPRPIWQATSAQAKVRGMGLSHAAVTLAFVLRLWTPASHRPAGHKPIQELRSGSRDRPANRHPPRRLPLRKRLPAKHNSCRARRRDDQPLFATWRDSVGDYGHGPRP